MQEPRRATICASVDVPGEQALAETWIESNRARLDFVSEAEGCMCCVVMWDIAGPAEVIATLPENLSAGSAWVFEGKR